MSRVITFSTRFPAYHTKAGEPTYFVDKLLKSFHGLGYAIHDIDVLTENKFPFVDEFVQDIWLPKKHTIRAGDRWKVGDKFSPRVWGGKPYRSPQVTLADDVEVKKVWDFTIKEYVDGWYIDFGSYSIPDTLPPSYSVLPLVARNDGLSLEDLLEWFKFPQPFNGQIICWDDTVNYLITNH